MASIPPKRLIFYICIILVLAYGVVSALSRTTEDPLARSLFIDRARNNADASATELATQGALAKDPFDDNDELEDDDELAQLNALSADDSAELDVIPVTEVTPTVTPVDTLNSDNVDEDGNDESGQDPRVLFSEAEQAEQAALDNGMMGGVRVSRGSGIVAPPDASGPIGSSLVWTSGQARGYTMLYAMQPEARAVVESHIETMLAARIREPYIGVLVDGTFGQDFEYLKTIIARLSVERNLTMVLYLTNGATQRKWNETKIDAPFVKEDPKLFRGKILSDQKLRAQFSALAAQARNILQYSLEQNPANQNLVSVMLEDNLDLAAYQTMRDLARQEVGSLASFIRSTCLRCFDPKDEGSDADTDGDAREEHKLELFSVLKRGDAFSLDGVGFAYPGEGAEAGVSPEQLNANIQASYLRGLRFFGLWRHNWQGVVSDGNKLTPDKRSYLPSTPEQEAFELSMLRLGLFVEPAPGDDDEQDGDVVMQ